MYKENLILIIAGILVLAAMLPLALAQSPADSVTVSVTIATRTWIDILPKSWTLTDVEPGTTWYNYSFTIENIGSTNITKIEANNSYPASNPFATGNASAYDAGNFLAIKLNTSNTFYFPNYVEYNDTDTWDFRWVSWPDSDARGRFRVAEREYLWAVKKGTNGDCANGTFAIGTSPKTYDTLGSTSLTSVTIINASGLYGCVDLNSLIPNIPSDLNGYMLWVKPDCTQVALVKYNKEIGPFKDSQNKCNNDVYLFGPFDATSDEALQPGEVIQLDLRMTIPYGVRAGDVTRGTLWLTAYGE
jgi:hypothetical protein